MSIKNYLKQNLALVLIVISGLILRLYNLTSISLWHDEAFSALLLKYSWGEMFYRIGLDVHPPLYYILLRIWHYIFSDALWSLRGFSVLFGIATIIGVYALVKYAFNNQRAAILAAILVALNPFQIQYVTEARMYTLGAFLVIIAAWSLVKALKTQRQLYLDDNQRIPNLPASIKLKKQTLLYYLLFTAFSAAAIYTHYYLIFTIAALGGYGLLYHWQIYRTKLRHYVLFLCACILTGLLFLPWLKIFLFQFQQVGAGYWIPPMDRWSIPDTLWRLLFGLYTDNIPNHTWLIIGTIITLFVVYKVLRKIAQHEKWLVTLAFLAPFAGSLLFMGLAKLRGENSSVYLVRYFLFTSGFFLIIIALWLDSIRAKTIRKTLLAALLAINLFAFVNYWKELKVKDKPGMAAAARFLKANVEPGHKIYVASSFMFFNYKYYNQTQVKPLLYSGGVTEVKSMPHYAGTAILTNQDLVPDFNVATRAGDTAWIIWTNGFGANKPKVPNNWTQIDERGYAEVRPYVGTWVIVTEYKVN